MKPHHQKRQSHSFSCVLLLCGQEGAIATCRACITILLMTMWIVPLMHAVIMVHPECTTSSAAHVLPDCLIACWASSKGSAALGSAGGSSQPKDDDF